MTKDKTIFDFVIKSFLITMVTRLFNNLIYSRLTSWSDLIRNLITLSKGKSYKEGFLESIIKATLADIATSQQFNLEFSRPNCFENEYSQTENV